MGRLKTLVNLVMLAVAAIIVWQEYQRVAERRESGSEPSGGPAAAGGGNRAADPLGSAIDSIRNVATQVATAATEITGLGPAQTESESDSGGSASAQAGTATTSADATAPAAGQPSASTADASQAQSGTGTATAQVDDPTLPAGAVRGEGSNTCPEAYPIKGNAGSMIYHLPGQPSYDRTVPEFCFATIEEAEAAGFRAPR